jgi:hypothetical protein
MVFAGFEEPDGYCLDARTADSCWRHRRPLITRETAFVKSVLRPWAARRLGVIPEVISKFSRHLPASILPWRNEL